MEPTNAHVDDQLELYALDALEPDAAAQVADHLAACQRCRELLAPSQRVVELLAWSPEQRQPSPAVRERLMAKLRAEADPTPPPPLRPRRWWQSVATPPMTGGSPVRGRLLSIAALALLLALVGNTVRTQRSIAQLQAQLQTQEQVVSLLRQPGVQIVTLASAGTTAGQGRLLVEPQGTQAVLVAAGLPALPEDKTYQLWLIHDATMVSAGLFQVDPQGSGIVPVQAQLQLHDYSGAGVTVEPRSGSSAPTSPPMLLGKF